MGSVFLYDLDTDNAVCGVYGYNTEVFPDIIPHKFHDIIPALFFKSRPGKNQRLFPEYAEVPVGTFRMKEYPMYVFWSLSPGASDNYNIDGLHTSRIRPLPLNQYNIQNAADGRGTA